MPPNTSGKERKKKTEKQKMLAGKIYHPFVEELTILRAKAHKLSRQFNNTDETDVEIMEAILDELLPHRGSGTYLQGPVQFDYLKHQYKSHCKPR